MADVFEVLSEGPLLATERDATDIIGEAGYVDWVLIPVERLSPEFFQLRTQIAGNFCQKFVTYGLRIVIVGDISNYESKSSAFRDFVRESNRGTHVWFVPDRAAFDLRLADTI